MKLRHNKDKDCESLVFTKHGNIHPGTFSLGNDFTPESSDRN